MYKNVASQLIPIFAWDSAAGTPKTGDAGNITAQISIDGGATAATNDVNPTELDATDAPGTYLFSMTQAETNGNLIIVSAVSSTADVDILPVHIYTIDFPDVNYADIADAVWDELSTGHTDSGEAGGQLWDNINAILHLCQSIMRFISTEKKGVVL